MFFPFFTAAALEIVRPQGVLPAFSSAEGLIASSPPG